MFSEKKQFCQREELWEKPRENTVFGTWINLSQQVLNNEIKSPDFRACNNFNICSIAGWHSSIC